MPFLIRSIHAPPPKLFSNWRLAAGQLFTYPHLGERLAKFALRDLKRLIVDDYELRYELTDKTITVLLLWYGREDQ